MRYKQLGSTGLFVSELCLGAMTFGGEQGGRWEAIGSLSSSDANAMVKRALDGGVNFIDTANVYHEGRSEELVGNALHNLGVARSDIIVATKVCGDMGAGPNDRGASRHHILNQVDASLRRLKSDYIDLYQLHAVDPVTPIEETLQALDDIIRAGKVRYVGVSNWPAWKIMKARGLSRQNRWAGFETVQSYYSLVGRDLERELVPLIEDEGLGLLVWSPLAGGYLSGKYNGIGAEGDGRRTAFNFPPVDLERGATCIEVLSAIARDRGCNAATVALAWLLHQPAVTSVIIGAKRHEQLEQNLAAVELVLSPDELAELNSASALPSEYPGWMLNLQSATRVPKPFQPTGASAPVK